MQADVPSGAREDRPGARPALAAIAGLTRRMSETWNAGDGPAYAAIFTPDCDYIAFDGTHLKGREENARHHQALFETVLKGTRLVFEGEAQIRFLSDGVALMHAMGSVLLPWQDRVTAKRRSNQTYVVVREKEGWCIAAFHNTRFRPMRLPTGRMLRLIRGLMRPRTAISRALA